MDSLLKVSDVSVRFGGVQALSGADLAVESGTVVSVIGPNGAGKTTLLGVISGAVRPMSGAVRLEGLDLSGLAAHDRARAGVVRTFQNLEIFTNMTVLENVMTGAHILGDYGLWHSLLRTPRFARRERRVREWSLEKLAFVGLADEWDTPAGDLPYGRQRLLEMARALASRPKVLLLDEPAAGMNTRETAGLAELVQRVKAELKVSVVLVEHDMDLVMEISDRVMVLNFGQVLAEGPPDRIQADPAVVAAYLGED